MTLKGNKVISVMVVVFLVTFVKLIRVNMTFLDRFLKKLDSMIRVACAKDVRRIYLSLRESHH